MTAPEKMHLDGPIHRKGDAGMFKISSPALTADIDLVQIKTGPIKPIMKRIGEVVAFFEENRSTKIGGHGAKALSFPFRISD